MPVVLACEAAGTARLPSDVADLPQRYGIAPDRFIDAGGIATYMDLMAATGAVLAFNVPPCAKADDAVRDTYGNCTPCNEKQLAFAGPRRRQPRLYLE